MKESDDGSLAFLNLKRDENVRYFNCDVVKASNILNTKIWIFDYIEDVKTKYSENQCLVKIKYDKDAPESEAKKFFTGSDEIKSILKKIKEMNAFPRCVTLRKGSGNQFFFE